ncbi:placenta-specific protein 9 [Candoia aspera]|uniref:placenta-specific protein 9 n=1 Tax=Candoia aspera TaxID=51853 RepID=UPI002FD84656
MLYPVSLLFLLILNHQGLAAGDPIADHRGTLEQDDWCDNPSTIHRRLDTIQEQLEKTVDHLDSEVKSLLNDVSETAWTKPLASGIPLVDLFEDPS